MGASLTDQAAISALSAQLSELLGEPTGQTTKLIAWSKGEFEVGLQTDEGPHLWISTRWRPSRPVFAGLQVDRYAASESRHHHLEANCPTLWKGHAARRISFVGNRVLATVDCVRACLEAASREDRPQN
jgi:hypothetical protein